MSERSPVRFWQSVVFTGVFVATCGWAEASGWARAGWILLTGAIAAVLWVMWWHRA